MKTYILLGLALMSAHLSLAQSNRSKAEVFIQIEDKGSFTVYLDNESVGSSTGRFRFYDVYNSSPVLSILQGSKKIFSNKLQVNADQRLVLSYSSRKGLKVAKELNLYRNRQYALDNFDDYTSAYNTGIVPPRPMSANTINSFDNLLNMVKNEPFDNGKIKIIQAYTATSDLTTAQAGMLLQHFTSDNQKLEVAKNLTPVISDLQRYYMLADFFTFKTAKDDFLTFLSNSNAEKSHYGMDKKTFEQLKASVKQASFDDDKTKIIQVAVQNSSPSTGQLAELLRLYSFEDKALIVAKSSYRFVNDKRNYFTLKEIFKFKSNQDSFLDYLSQQ